MNLSVSLVKCGFTVLEIAIAIAIMSILAAVNYPMLSGILTGADKQGANDFALQLQSAGQIYSNKTFKKPNGFTDFVTYTAPTGKYTISLNGFGLPTKSCAIAPEVIRCTATTANVSNIKFFWDNGKVMASFEGQIANVSSNNGIYGP